MINSSLDSRLIRKGEYFVAVKGENHHEIVNKDLVGFELEDKLLNHANSEILKSWLGARDGYNS